MSKKIRRTEHQRGYLTAMAEQRVAGQNIASLKQKLKDAEDLRTRIERIEAERGIMQEPELTFKEQLRASFNKKKQVSVKQTNISDNPEFEEI